MAHNALLQIASGEERADGGQAHRVPPDWPAQGEAAIGPGSAERREPHFPASFARYDRQNGEADRGQAVCAVLSALLVAGINLRQVEERSCIALVRGVADVKEWAAKSMVCADKPEHQGAIVRFLETRVLQREAHRQSLAIVTGGRGVAVRAMTSVSAMLSWAVSKGLLKENPAFRVKKLPDRRRERFLSEEEVQRMFQAMGDLERSGEISPASHDVIMLLALTGARQSEVIGLRWSEVDMNHGHATLPPDRHKTGSSGASRILHFNEAALSVLKRRPRHTEFVFPDSTGHQPIKRVQDAWEKVRDRADLRDAVLYTLRHSFASFAIDEGESLYVVGRALGHRKAATTERYAHIRATLAQRVASSVGTKMAALAKKADENR